MDTDPKIVQAAKGLLAKCATTLPSDVQAALSRTSSASTGLAKVMMDDVMENIDLARSSNAPICQDTGSPIFFVKAPGGYDVQLIKDSIILAVADATKEIPLRANAVDTLTSANSKDNTGIGMPSIHIEAQDRTTIEISLLLKGGGSENLTRIYHLPDHFLRAGRDLEGVKKAVLHAIYSAQGKGCPPYFIGVCFGGLADSCIKESKTQLMRQVQDVNPEPILSECEADILASANGLGIGPQGLGGDGTVASVKISSLHRHPASYIVAVSFSCWALRRAKVEVTHD